MSKKLTTNSFIEKAKLIHGDKYCYSNVNYVNNYSKVEIICLEHGIFEQTPNMHLLGKKCKLCAINDRIKKKTSNTDIFINESNIVHKNKYNYNKTNYLGAKIKLIITCPIHGEFEQTPDNHLRGSGCPSCKQSKGEIEIGQFLKLNNINFKKQHRFKECKFKNPLIFDFFVPNYNMCIEYDGEQHFKSVKFWGGDNGLKERQVKDKIKTEYCQKNNITLVRIKFNDNISHILTEMFTIGYL